MNPSTAINRNWQNVMVLTQLGTSLKAINIESHDLDLFVRHLSISLNNSQGEHVLDLTILNLCSQANGLLTKPRSKWLDIDQLSLFVSLWTETESKSISQKKRRETCQLAAILTKQAGTL